MRLQIPKNHTSCKVCNGSGKYKIFVDDDVPPLTTYECENCIGKGYLREDSPNSEVKFPKWV